MLIAFPLFLLLLFAAVFWVLRDTKHVWVRTGIIAGFFGFCVSLSASLDSIMGWAAHNNMPEIVVIRHVVIKEPSASSGQPGAIFILIEHPSTRHNLFLRTFGYNATHPEPRLFKLPYSRSLHEQMQGIMGKLNNGQTVTGKLSKGKGKGKGKQGEDGEEGEEGEEGEGKGKGKKGQNGKGDGSDSLEVPWVFHVLPPSYFMRKDHQE